MSYIKAGRKKGRAQPVSSEGTQELDALRMGVRYIALDPGAHVEVPVAPASKARPDRLVRWRPLEGNLCA
jgi:hypothetical protein